MKRTVTRMTAVFALIGAIGSPVHADDWPEFRHDRRRSGHTHEDLRPAELRASWTWRSPLPPVAAWPAPARWDAYADIRGLQAMRDYDRAFQVICVGDRLWVGSNSDDALHCIDLRSGQEQWLFHADGPIRMAPAFADNRIYFGADDGHARCVDAVDGTLIWKSPPLTDADLIINNGRLISPLPCRTGVVVHESIAYFGCSLLPWQETWLCAVDAQSGTHEGDGLFLRRTGGQTLEGGLLVHRDQIIALRGRVPPFVFDRASGEEVAALPDGGGGVFATLTDQGKLFHGPGNKTGWVYRTDLATQEREETFADQTGVVLTDDCHVYFSDHAVTAVAPDTGATLWRAAVRNIQDVIVAGDDVFVGQRDAVCALALDDGTRHWTAPVRGDACGLAVASGRLIVSTDTGTLHCFEHSADGSTSETPVAASKPSSGRRAAKSATAATDAGTAAALVALQPQGMVHSWRFHAGMGHRARRRGLPDPERRVQDEIGALDALVSGDIQLREVGGVEAIVLDGSTNAVMIAEDHNAAALPAESLTAEAWVRVDRPSRWGGILGAIQDNGAFERGWSLGFQNSRFSFAVAAAEGPDKLTYLAGTTEFQPRHWYHVVGTYDGRTQRLYVNGQLESESAEQRGPLQYPERAFFEIGAYHDDDEYYRLEGMLHAVSLYDRVLMEEEIAARYAAKSAMFPVPATLASGPVASFTDFEEATITWSTASPSATHLTLAESHRQRVFSDPEPRTHHVVTIPDLARQRMATYQIATSRDGRQETTQEFELDTRFNFVPPPLNAATSPPRPSTPADRSGRTADAILAATGIDRGTCIVIGLTDARLALELGRRSRLTVVGVDTDADRIAETRRMLTAQGAYGTRVSVRHVDSFERLPFVGQMANLIISERQMSGAALPGGITEVCRLLRPCGGTAVLRASDSGKKRAMAQHWPATLQSCTHSVNSDVGQLLKLVRPASPGSGEWSHLYGTAANAAFGGESLGGASTTGELRVQWIGRPGPRAQPDRSGRKPSPLSRNGRLYVQGQHRLIAVDAYNGTPLWTLEIPALERFNMPRDCGNWCADDDCVFVAVRDQCLQIDGQTGRIQARHPVLPVAERDWDCDWGYVARVGSTLLGSSVRQGTAYTNYWGNADAGWYDARSGPATFKVCSDALFAKSVSDAAPASEVETPQAAGDALLWTYAKGVIINSTITATEEFTWFVECRHPAVTESSARRVGMAELWQDQFLVCLDTKTGRTLWQREIDTADGIVMFSLAASDGRLVLCASVDGNYHVYCLSAADGSPQWEQSFGWPGGKGDHGKAMSRPAVVGDMVYVRPRVMRLSTGEMQSLTMPGGGCGTYAATTNALFFRSGNITAWNTDSGSTTDWNRLRPGCWLSTIPANGMLLSPEAGGGCSCGSWMETSIGFMPMQSDTAFPE